LGMRGAWGRGGWGKTGAGIDVPGMCEGVMV
jgi:hypothetical protein